jgi:hypothetical protein
MDWVLLSYKLPSEPSAPRVRAWRKLKRLGALLLHDTLWVLPATARTREHVQWLVVEIRDAGGDATAWVGAALLPDQEATVLAALHAQVAPAYQAILAALDTPDPDLPTLARRYQQIVTQDHGASPLAALVRTALVAAQQGDAP